MVDSPVEAAMTNNLPPAPQRQDYQDEESFQEALGYWRTHVGRIQALAKTSTGSLPNPSPSPVKHSQ